MTLRAFPWTHLTFHGCNRSDWIMFIPPWCDMAPEEMDMDNKSHFAKVSYGRLILLFESRIAEHVSRPAASDCRCLAFVEELWEYTPSESDIDPIRTEFGCRRLYRTDPEPTYYVLDVWRILGDAPIIADPINPTIPFKALKYNGPARSNPNPCARADSSPKKHDGSALFIVNKWMFDRAYATPGSDGTLGMGCQSLW